MITKVLVMAGAFICADLYGAITFDHFGGVYTWPDGFFSSSGFPDEVHPKDCSPDTIRIEHITPILEIYEKNLRKGTLLDAIQVSANDETIYLLSFVGDERFSSLIYDQYAERLFEEFGDKEASTVLLYYKTGGCLEKLRTLYQQPVNDDVKKAIEACFFDASVGLLEKHEQDVADATPQPLSVKLSTQYRSRKYYTKDLAGEIPDDLFGGSDGIRYLQESTTNERDLIITYENTTKNRLIQIEIPRRKNGNCWCDLNVMRSAGVPVFPRMYGRGHEHENQFITLYPGDNYIRKVDLNFTVTSGRAVIQLFSDFGKYSVVLGDYRVGNAVDSFQVMLNYTCNYFTARSVEELDQIIDSDWRMIRAGPLSLDYEPQTPVDSKSALMRTQQDKAWNLIMEHWKNLP